ncbi:MAG: tRNA threonylcarbamoyladenosine dehydratase, partial [Raoultibacter sp.]
MDGQSATSKLELILGSEGVAQLASSTVMVLGLGGVGSNCVEALARGGVGRLIVVDHDVVQESNINRQAIAYRSTIGKKKAEVMRCMIADINPDAEVIALDMFVLKENLAGLIEAYRDRLDYVVDAIDTVSTKLALAEYADQEGITLISSMGAANKLYPECFKLADIYDTVNCPLCRVIRKEARKRGIGALRVLYSCEQPVDVPTREGATRKERSNLGTASFVPPIMGQMIAGEVIRDLSGIA